MVSFSTKAFKILAKELLGFDSNRKFKAHFGVTPEVCAEVWYSIKKPTNARPKHLLWALLFLKLYETEDVLIAKLQVKSRETLRKWVWVMVQAIAGLSKSKIRWANRLKHDRFNKWCRVTIDGTDFKINEPSPFSPMWYSHKYCGPGIRYEIGVSINGGDIVHINGPFPCGAWADLTIFRSKLMHMLLPGEMVEADNGYRGEYQKIRTPVDYSNEEERRAKRRARARHETVNRRFKQFGILKQVYRHRLCDHGAVFHACAALTQISINHGNTLFCVQYH